MLKMISCLNANILQSDNASIEKLPYHTLILVSDGHVRLNKQRLGVSEGAFIHAGTPIKLESDTQDIASVFRITLDGEDTEDLIKARGLSDDIAFFTLCDAKRALELAQLMCNACSPDSELLYSEAAARMLLSFIRTSSGDTPSVGNTYVDRAIRYITDNLSDALRVEEISAMLGIDRMYLRNLFVKYTGASTMEYIIQARMDTAKKLLENKLLSVTEVAASVGYPDVLAFSKAFKKHVGASPTEYREKNKRQAQRAKKKEQIPVFIL